MPKPATAVIDASLAIYSVINSPMTAQAAAIFDHFQENRTRLYAPRLWWYEVPSVVHKYLFDGLLTEAYAEEALTILLNLAVNRVDEDDSLCRSAFSWATRITQKPAYDSFYLAAAELLDADLWTADQRLAQRARQLGIDWVHWVGEKPE